MTVKDPIDSLDPSLLPSDFSCAIKSIKPGEGNGIFELVSYSNKIHFLQILKWLALNKLANHRHINQQERKRERRSRVQLEF